MDPILLLGSLTYALISAGTVPLFARRYIRGRSFHMLPTKNSLGVTKFKVTPGPREELLPVKDIPPMVDAAYEAAAWRSLFWPLTLIAHFSDGAQAKTRKRLIAETSAEELGRYRTALSLLAYRAGQEHEPLMARIAGAENEEELRACERLLRGDDEVLKYSLLDQPQSLSEAKEPVKAIAPPAGHHWTATSVDVGTSYEAVMIGLASQTDLQVTSDKFYIHVYKTPEAQQEEVIRLQEKLVAQFYSTGEIPAPVLELVGPPQASLRLIPQSTPLPLLAAGSRPPKISGKTPLGTKATHYGFGKRKLTKGSIDD